MNVSVCIAATRPDTVGAAVRSIVKQSYQDWELVVVCQGSAEVAAVARKALGRHEGQVVALPGRGKSRALNAAVAAATGDLIAMTDDDCEAAPDWLEVLVAKLKASPQVGMIGGTLAAPPKSHWGLGTCPSCAPADVLYDPAVSGHLPPAGFAWIGANFAFRSSTADTVGPFDELLGPGARFPESEDVDFQYRAVEHGIVMQTAAAAVVNHTYGWRYGLRRGWRYQRDHCRGNGAFAAKLTLLNDPHGRVALEQHTRMASREWWERRSPAALPRAMRRYYHYSAGYRECLTGFVVDSEGLLREKHSQETR